MKDYLIQAKLCDCCGKETFIIGRYDSREKADKILKLLLIYLDCRGFEVKCLPVYRCYLDVHKEFFLLFEVVDISEEAVKKGQRALQKLAESPLL